MMMMMPFTCSLKNHPDPSSCQHAFKAPELPTTTAIPFTGLFIDASCKFTV
jgi:hypothetical protein